MITKRLPATAAGNLLWRVWSCALCTHVFTRTSSASGGNSPKLTFIGWKCLPSAPPVICASKLPSAVVAGGDVSWPAANLPASNPIAALSTYPSTPVICPAKRICGAAFKRKSPVSNFGLWIKVLRCSPPRRTELCFLQPWYHTKDLLLFAIFQLGLETDHIIQRAELIILTQLYHGKRLLRPMRIFKPHRLHRTKAQCFPAAFRHHFHRQTALKIGRIFFPFTELRFLPAEQRVYKSIILILRKRAVDVIRPLPFIIA